MSSGVPMRCGGSSAVCFSRVPGSRSNHASMRGTRIKPGEIGCPTLIRGSEWARSLKFYQPNSQCQAEDRKCPEYIQGELRLQVPKESR